MRVVPLLVLGLVGLILIAAVVLIVVLVARRSQRPAATPPMVPPPQRPLPPEAAAQIESLLQQRRQIQAIKVYRDYTSAGLASAKAAIDHWPIAGPPNAAPDPRWAQVEQGARAIAATEGEIAAIKWVREQTGLGLAEAKAMVDRLA